MAPWSMPRSRADFLDLHRPHPNFYIDARPEPVDDGHQAVDGEAIQVRIADAREVGRRDAGWPPPRFRASLASPGRSVLPSRIVRIYTAPGASAGTTDPVADGRTWETGISCLDHAQKGGVGHAEANRHPADADGRGESGFSDVHGVLAWNSILP